MKSPARRGLDALLEMYPEAEPLEVYSQHETVVAVYNLQRPTEFGRGYLASSIPRDPGAWTVADLADDGKALRFAIWNATGNVYRVDEHGAAEDDPFITITGGT